MRQWIIAIILVMAGIGGTACNTMAGLGKDIEKGGEAIQRAVK